MCTYTNANAWFFFFIPGSATRGVADAISGAKGDICVKDTTKVGDVIPSIAGNTMKITSLSGTSSICANPALPIRAEVDYTFTFKSNAGVNLSDDYEAKPLNDYQRYSGTLLTASSKSTRNKGVLINAREKKPNSDAQGLATGLETSQKANLVDAVTKNSEQLKINGASAWRFEVHGKTKGVFGTDMVYIITVLEGDNEILIVNSYTTQSNYENDKQELKKISSEISGITAGAPVPQSNTVAQQVQNNEPIPVVSTPAVETSSNTSQVSTKLRELSKLLSDGLITQKDFDVKKAEILKNL